MRVLLATAALVIATSGTASAMDADRRLPERPERDPGRLLIADLKPDSHCLRVRTIPVAQGRSLLYVPCQDDLVLPAPKPLGDRPPIIIPVERAG